MRNRIVAAMFLVVVAAIFVVSACWKDENIEVSGTLTESNSKKKIHSVQVANVPVSNRTLRWGISRSKEGELPRADPGTPEIIKKYGGIYIGDTNKKEIFLTFDEGYESGQTTKILDTLKNNKVKAVFFITGHYVKSNEELIRRMIDEGHTLGNHTINHPSLSEISDEKMQQEVQGLNDMVFQKFNYKMKLLRPPKGEYSIRTLEVTKNMGFINVFWSFAYDDWNKDKVRGTQYAHDIVCRNLHNGAILLLHAVSQDNADALESIIKTCREKGYEIGVLNNLVTQTEENAYETG